MVFKLRAAQDQAARAVKAGRAALDPSSSLRAS
jgi:hypothetical protein